jgi:hypothetical protein
MKVITFPRNNERFYYADIGQLKCSIRAVWIRLHEAVIFLLLMFYAASCELLAAQKVPVRSEFDWSAPAVNTVSDVPKPAELHDNSDDPVQQQPDTSSLVVSAVQPDPEGNNWQKKVIFDFGKHGAGSTPGQTKQAVTTRGVPGPDTDSVSRVMAKSTPPGVRQATISSQTAASESGVENPAPRSVKKKRVGLKFAFPLKVSGVYSGLVQWDESQKNDIESVRYLNQLNLALNSYIWKPWFALLDGNIGFNVEKYDNRDLPDTKNQFVTGNANLNVFPRSRFPFSAFIEKTENKNELQTNGLDYDLFRVYLDQKYRDETGRHYFSANLEHRKRESDHDGSERTDQLKTDYQVNLDDHRILLGIDGYKSRNNFLNTKSKMINMLGRHTLLGKRNASVESMMTYVDLSTDFINRKRDIATGQVSSFVRWRPESRDQWQFTGSARLSSNDLKTRGGAIGSSQKLETIAINTAATYQYSDSVTFRGGMSAIDARRKDSDRFIHSQNLGVSYRPLEVSLGEAAYNWSTSSQMQNRSVEGEGEQSVNWSFTHGISRMLNFSSSDLHLSFSQAGRVSYSSEVDQREQIDHTALLNWSKGVSRSRTDFRITYSDSRSLELDPSTYQLLNVQLDKHYAVDRDTDWTASITIQGIRQQPAGPDEGTLVDVFSNGSFLYRKSNFFGLPRLHFNAELELISNGLTPDRYDIETNIIRGDEEQRLRAEFRYRVGKMNLHFITRILRIDGDVDKSVQFQLSRTLGN